MKIRKLPFKQRSFSVDVNELVRITHEILAQMSDNHKHEWAEFMKNADRHTFDRRTLN